MRFNRFIWDIYVQSQRGLKAVERFSNLTDDFIEPWCRTYDFEFKDEFKDQYPMEKFSVDVPKLVRDSVSSSKFTDLEAAIRYCKDVLARDGMSFKITDKAGNVEDIFIFGSDDWYDRIAAVSLGLYRGQPDFFLPYNFRCKFNQLEVSMGDIIALILRIRC